MKQTGQRRPREPAERQTPGINGTFQRLTYRELSGILGYAPTSIWRAANRDQPVSRKGYRRTVTRERRFERQMLVLIAHRARGLSLRQIAARLRCGKSSVARDLQTLAQYEAQGVDVLALAFKHFADDVIDAADR